MKSTPKISPPAREVLKALREYIPLILLVMQGLSTIRSGQFTGPEKMEILYSLIHGILLIRQSPLAESPVLRVALETIYQLYKVQEPKS
jgi:TRAP-type C4-dicarboxylate transport system permease large subunit